MLRFQVLLVILSVVTLATCYTCYICNHISTAENNSGCDPFNSSLVYIVECDTANFANVGCLYFKAQNQYGNITETGRGCALHNETTKMTCDHIENIIQENNDNYSLLSCSVCNSNYCNSATIFKRMTWWIFIGILMTMLINQ